MWDPRDVDDLDNHHPTCPNGCGELADECMCNWPPSAFIDGRDPATIEHLCIIDLTIHDGPVEECCVAEWRAERAALDDAV
jgi:hypothetical protein